MFYNSFITFPLSDKFILIRDEPQILRIFLRESFRLDDQLIRMVLLFLVIRRLTDLPCFLLVYIFSPMFVCPSLNFSSQPISKPKKLTSQNIFQVIVSLYIISVIGNYFSLVNLLYFGNNISTSSHC